MRSKNRRAISKLGIILIIIIILIVAVGAGIYILSGTQSTHSTTSSNSGALILYSADAYVAEATALSSGFTNSTGVSVAPPKSGGSLTLGQEISQGNPVSVFLSVSKTAVSKSVLNSTFPGWAIAFASDQMALTYSSATNQSTSVAAVITSYQEAVSSNTTASWFNFFSNITSGSVKVGISNPNSDPAGFRGWLVLQAAGYLYANNTNYFVNRMLSNNGNITAASAADLISPLQEGNIQFLFIYKSAGLAQKLNIMQLPPQINFGSSEYSSLYAKFSYPTSSGVQTGGVIALFISVPSDSTDPTDSLSFVSYVVKNAPSLLTQYGLAGLSPAKLYNDSDVPQPIQQLLSQGLISESGSL